MTEFVIYELFTESIMLSFKLATPTLLAGMLVGIMISIFQTATSIQEQSLSFIPKLFITGLIMMWLAPWIFTEISQFAIRIMGQLQIYAR